MAINGQFLALALLGAFLSIEQVTIAEQITDTRRPHSWTRFREHFKGTLPKDINGGKKSAPKASSCVPAPAPNDISSIPCTGIIITTPGNYRLLNNIIYSPSCGCTNPAIEIAADNVTLDFGGATLSQVDKSVLEIVGVKVDQGLNNIAIINGTITSFSKIGILAGDPTSTPGPTTTNLRVANINALGNGTQAVAYSWPCELGGLIVTSGQGISIESCNLNQNFLNGIGASGIVNMTIRNCHCDDTTWGNAQFFTVPPVAGVNFAQAFGFSLFNFEPSKNITVVNSTFDNTFFLAGGGAIVTDDFGGGPTQNLTIDSSTLNGTTVLIADPEVINAIPSGPPGIAAFLHADTAVISHCEFLGTNVTVSIPFTAGLLGTTLETGGVELVGSNFSVSNCSAGNSSFTNTSGVPLQVYNLNYRIFLNEGSFKKCKSFGSTNVDSSVPQSLLVISGYDVVASGNIFFEDCVSLGNTQAAQSPNIPGAQFSSVSGFTGHVYSFGSTVFKRCISSGNTDTFNGPNAGQASGFNTREAAAPGDVIKKYVFDSCISESNTTLLGQGCGFDILNLDDSKIVNCLAEGNDIGIQLSIFTETTTISAASNGQSLPQPIINVVNASGFATNPNTGVGMAIVQTSAGPQTVTFTGTTPTSLTGTSGGVGVMSTGGLVTYGIGGQTTGNVIKNNIVQANNFYGILDKSQGTNVFCENQAKANGATPAQCKNDSNYSNGVSTIKNAPIRRWLLPCLPEKKDNRGKLDPRDNISIN